MATVKKKSKAPKQAAKPDNVLSNRCIPVRFTEKQYRQIAAEAASVGKTVTQEVRDAVVEFFGLARVVVKPGPRAA